MSPRGAAHTGCVSRHESSRPDTRVPCVVSCVIVCAKMTGSIFDFASRTCASTTVPRELALGAGSSGMIHVSTATSSSAATAIAEERSERALASTRGCQNDELDIRRSEPRAPCQALLPIVSLLPLPLPLTRTHAPIASLSGLCVNESAEIASRFDEVKRKSRDVAFRLASPCVEAAEFASVQPSRERRCVSSVPCCALRVCVNHVIWCEYRYSTAPFECASRPYANAC